jgi:hypothetical protein
MRHYLPWATNRNWSSTRPAFATGLWGFSLAREFRTTLAFLHENEVFAGQMHLDGIAR